LTHQRASVLTIVVTAALGLAACGAPGSPGIATVGKGGGGASTATTVPSGDPSQLLEEWASCMREHGDPNQVDPSIDANKVIHISIAPSIRGGYDGYSGEYGNGGPGTHCRSYLGKAQSELRGGEPQERVSSAMLLKFSECMRANGIADFPDPTSQGLVLNMRGDLVPSNPAFQRASRLCAKQTGVPGLGGATQPGMIVLVGGGPPP
jgi:hypothetical protein